MASSARARPLITFIVPTLNRGRYVIRAVDSCLAVERAGADVEVIVIDSQSDDGSFEAMVERFGGRDDVQLLQNRRGLGPTHSWLDGARAARGDYVTFVWSDDYIAPDFLTRLRPHLGDGREVAYGQGAIRNVDDESPLPVDAGVDSFTAAVLVEAYYDVVQRGSLSLPVSPCCSLFTSAAFTQWRDGLEAWARATPLRELLIWRRAIGPDLMLFLEALLQSRGAITRHRSATAQFSSHPGSITVSSHPWPYQTGYWLARCWALGRTEDASLFRLNARRALAFGVGLWLEALAGRAGDVPNAARHVGMELSAIRRECIRRGVWGSVAGALPVELGRLVLWRTFNSAARALRRRGNQDR